MVPSNHPDRGHFIANMNPYKTSPRRRSHLSTHAAQADTRLCNTPASRVTHHLRPTDSVGCPLTYQRLALRPFLEKGTFSGQRHRHKHRLGPKTPPFSMQLTRRVEPSKAVQFLGAVTLHTIPLECRSPAVHRVPLVDGGTPKVGVTGLLPLPSRNHWCPALGQVVILCSIHWHQRTAHATTAMGLTGDPCVLVRPKHDRRCRLLYTGHIHCRHRLHIPSHAHMRGYESNTSCMAM